MSDKTPKKESPKKGSGINWKYIASVIFIVALALYSWFGTSSSNSSSSTDSATESSQSATTNSSNSDNSSSSNSDSSSSSNSSSSSSSSSSSTVSNDQIPSYTGAAYTELGDRPNFTDEELASDTFIDLSDLDSLGRCGVAFALIGPETMPSKDTERGSIREIRPSGWRSVRFESLISDENSDGHVYERSHLLGWALTGLNAEARNLITGTHYFNDDSMRPFEVKIARYVEKKDGHVLYRVTPIYSGNDLVAQGVRMEALSVEDNGESVCFDVFVYNVQPGFTIDYSDGYVTSDDGESAN